MISVTNLYDQLLINIDGQQNFYQFPKLSNITWTLNRDGNYYIQLTYEDDYFVKINLAEVSTISNPGWTNNLAGAQYAVNEIASWIGADTNVVINSPIGSQPDNKSVSVTIANNEEGIGVTPFFVRTSTTGSVSTKCYSLSVSNVGAANGTFLSSTIKPGETLNFNAGAINNIYASSTFSWDGTGTELIIIYNA
jgi:hypothetical protein